MQFHNSLSRLSAFLLFFLSSMALLACASPIAAPAAAVALPEHGLVPRGTCVVGCTTGTKTADILVQLDLDIKVQLDLLDKCLENGTKPDDIIIKIEALINVAVAAIVKLDVDLLGLLNGKITIIVNLLVSILISVATHCGKWASKGAAEFEVFLQLCVKLDIALKALLSTCNGLGAVLLLLIKVLINVSVLIKVKFNLCIGLLGL
ncbi:unnamed protein product [Rhizoctonia solani]|uniref:Transmembrane protein n=1 Tax=Rhizoctonia solani TaxID=456999 RepID=A0A8H3H633_9AGAM|nr:unnamed protein product [Rhizoctonia solani]